MFLLDTDTIIYSLKGNDSVVRNLTAHQRDPLKISVISLMELYYGAYLRKQQQICQKCGASKVRLTLYQWIFPLLKRLE